MNYFVTGTDTGVGKTYVTSLILEALRAEGAYPVGFKPVSCGDRDDADLLSKASGGLDLDEINPLHFQAPLAPYTAALLENTEIQIPQILTSYERIAAKYDQIFVEGAGGWEVPLTPKYFISDLAKDLQLPVIIIAANRLGALNHIILTIHAIQAKGLSCAGVILNQLEDEMDTPMITNKGILETLTDAPLLDHIIHGQDFISPELLEFLQK